MYYTWNGKQWLPAYYTVRDGLPTGWHIAFLVLGFFTFGILWVIWPFAAGIAEYNAFRDEKRAETAIQAYYDRILKG